MSRITRPGRDHVICNASLSRSGFDYVESGLLQNTGEPYAEDLLYQGAQQEHAHTVAESL